MILRLWNLGGMTQVTTPDITIKKYIRALPDCVADFVQAAKPTTIEETYQLTAEINDKRVLAESQGNKNKNYATTTAPLNAAPVTNQNRQVAAPVTNAPPAKRAYTGPHPLCPTCTYHHPVGIAYRFCVHCNHYGHFTANCRTGPLQQAQAQAPPALPVPLPAPQGSQAAPAPVAHARSCYSCGDPNHFANVCPNRVVKQQPQQPPQQQQQQPQQQQQQP
ncbi:uncharacterized protein LOC110913916 [Helianthus annuus]|uniref:uncharacterized protein LOC110913916 n=1 Tax=Helianthus annuus TaxID=4232 RepID=UPI000B8EF7FF|nr:uncharacterized protein LOC110913916 [Helianthus annuus]